MATSAVDEKVFSEPLILNGSNFPYFVHIISLLAFISTALASVFIYRKLRRNIPVNVNCWFCCGNTKVPYAELNGWICPTCEQYNGFNQEGDYNRVIKEQYDEKLNVAVFNKLRKSRVVSSKSSIPETKIEGFCKLCNINQKLKIQQLALFVPLNESNYDNEVEEYRRKLENAYKLCPNCDNVVKATLEKQESGFLKNQIKLVDQMSMDANDLREIESFYGGMKFINCHRNKGVKLIKILLMLSSGVLLTALLSKWEREKNQIIATKLPYLTLLMMYFEPASERVAIYLMQIFNFRREISLIAFLMSLLLLANNQGNKEKLKAFTWALLHTALWFPYLGLHVLISAVCTMFNCQIKESSKFILTKKPCKVTLESAKGRQKGFKSASNCSSNVVERLSSPECSFSKGNVNIWRNRLIGGNKQREHHEETKENEVESLTNEELGIPGVHRSSRLTHDTSPSNSSVNACFSSFPESGRRERELSPGLSQVFTDLSSLSLGQKQAGKCKKKPSNFLFENHEFFKKCPPSSSPIIKPAKLVPSSTPWMCQESGDSFSRSSTPSSGYSSQKLDTHFDLGKCTGSTLSGTPFGRRHHFACCDPESARFYNINWCPYEFVPFNHYSSSAGHAALFTMGTRPTSLPPHPFSTARCPSWRLPSNFSETNTFENASKTFADGKKWFKIKTVSYYFSIFLNCVTFVVLVYLLSSGLVSIDWNLPHTNMFA